MKKNATGTDTADGWIQWSGGRCPVAPVLVVEFKCGDDRVEKMRACDLEWNHQGDFTDITAYRIAK